MERREPSRLESAILFLLKALPDTVTRTKLVKLLYLVDLTAAERPEGRKTLTGAQYRSYHYGPFADEIGSALHHLRGHEILEFEKFSPSGNRYYAYSLGDRPRYSRLDLSEEDKALLDEVIARYGALPLSEILGIVYETQPYRDAEIGEYILLRHEPAHP